jgi:hypothetical protein
MEAAYGVASAVDNGYQQRGFILHHIIFVKENN